MSDINWLSDDDFAKQRGKFKMHIAAVLMKAFGMYGFQNDVGEVAELITRFADDYSLILRGQTDKPIRMPRGWGKYK